MMGFSGNSPCTSHLPVPSPWPNRLIILLVFSKRIPLLLAFLISRMRFKESAFCSSSTSAFCTFAGREDAYCGSTLSSADACGSCSNSNLASSADSPKLRYGNGAGALTACDEGSVDTRAVDWLCFCESDGPAKSACVPVGPRSSALLLLRGGSIAKSPTAPSCVSGVGPAHTSSFCKRIFRSSDPSQTFSLPGPYPRIGFGAVSSSL